MNPRWTGLAQFSSVFLRLALGISFLSAVADRSGLWGVHRQPNVSRGNYARFVDYTAKLNWFLPAAMIPTLAIIATAAETLFGLLLVLGGKTRITALLSGVLVTTFPLCAHGLAHEQTTRFARSFDFVAGEVMAGHERANGNICSRHAQKFARVVPGAISSATLDSFCDGRGCVQWQPDATVAGRRLSLECLNGLG